MGNQNILFSFANVKIFNVFIALSFWADKIVIILVDFFISYFPKVKEKYLPFSTAHNVIVQLFVQIVEERHSLNQSES